MIRAVGNKRLDLSESEFLYYKTLVKEFGDKSFLGLFTTDRNGIITSVTPPVNNVTHVGIIYYILNVMMNQRVRMLDDELKKVSENIATQDSVAKVVARVERLEATVFGAKLDETT